VTLPDPEVSTPRSGEPRYSEATPHTRANIVDEMEPMTPYESLPERLIREAIDAGEFDDLPGAGKPLPGAGVPDDDLWWVREWIIRNRDEATDH
jgi:hypothetical protein